MRNIDFRQLILAIFLGFFAPMTFAWDNSIQIGYGTSHDPNHTKYTNSGFLLSGDIYPVYHSFLTYWSIGAAVGRWHTTAPVNKSLTTGAVTLNMRLYPLYQFEYPPYLYASAGPAYLSSKQFGLNTQASNFSIQSNLGVGIELCHLDVNLRLEHFSNAGLGHPNEGFNVLYLLSVGYLF